LSLALIRFFSAKKWIPRKPATVTSITPRRIVPAGPGRFGSPAALRPAKGIPQNKVTVMKECTTPAQIKACRALALERNRQLFEEAQALNRAAHELLESDQLDIQQFDHYRALRKKADLKFEEAIEHLCVLNEDFPPIPMSAQNSQRLREQLETSV
jgi:hypothetical protein